MTKTLQSTALPVYLLLLSIPFGPAAQNIVTGIVVALLLVRFFLIPPSERFSLAPSLVWATLAAFTYTIWIFLSTVANSGKEVSLAGNFVGLLVWSLLPYAFAKMLPSLSENAWQKFGKLLAILAFLWSMVMISQALSGWRVSGSTFIPIDESRPRGFYSHPLTLAYVLLLFWPLSLNWVKRGASQFWSWLLLVSICSGLILTQSRTVQVVAIFEAVYVFLKGSSGLKKASVLAALVVIAGLFFSTNNGLTRKYRDTFSIQGVDKHSDYADDRLAFWHAHLGLIEERPLIGHGWGIDDNYRRPYYDKIGLPNFIKPYPAHNTFLEILTEGGAVGLVLFLIWLGSFLSFFVKLPDFLKGISLQTFTCLFIAALTQNAFQDFEVRWGLTLFCIGVILASPSQLRTRSALQYGIEDN